MGLSHARHETGLSVARAFDAQAASTQVSANSFPQQYTQASHADSGAIDHFELEAGYTSLADKLENFIRIGDLESATSLMLSELYAAQVSGSEVRLNDMTLMACNLRTLLEANGEYGVAASLSQGMHTFGFQGLSAAPVISGTSGAYDVMGELAADIQADLQSQQSRLETVAANNKGDTSGFSESVNATHLRGIEEQQHSAVAETAPVENIAAFLLGRDETPAPTVNFTLKPPPAFSATLAGPGMAA